jgi:hypothetical protein
MPGKSLLACACLRAFSQQIKTASEDAKAAMQKLETALNDTYVTPREPATGTKVVM